jgi:TetR/AcrR family transcriptional regulator, fatty acid metabolism regulator protein
MSYRKTPSTEERKEGRRRRLLDSAIKLFGTHGYHATTVPMIVAAAESSTGSFYMYFRNKEDVFNAALEELGRTIAEVLAQARDSQPDSLKKISKGAEALFLYLAQNPEQARILILESSGLSPKLQETYRAILRYQAEELRQMIESAPDVFDVENSIAAGRCIVGATYEALYCWLEENPKTRMQAADMARAVARFNTHAVKKVRSRQTVGQRRI